MRKKNFKEKHQMCDSINNKLSLNQRLKSGTTK